MELTNELDVPAPREKAWSVLTDVARVADCLPGATLISSAGDLHEGSLKVKVGPIKMQYLGTMAFVELDEAAGRIVLRGEGRDNRGQSTASALITLALSGDGGPTRVAITTDLQITGRVAQFGRNVLADVSDSLVGQFAENLQQEVLGTRAVPTAKPEPGAAARTPHDGPVDAAAPFRGPASGPDDYADLGPAIGGVIKTRLPVASVVVLAGFLGWLMGSRHDR